MPRDIRPVPAGTYAAVLVLTVCVAGGTRAAVPREDFAEAVTLRRLAGPPAFTGEETALANFSFAISLDNVTRAGAQHTGIFPAALVQLLQANDVEDLHLSMTSGFWDDTLWGAAHAPPGVVLRAMVPTGSRERAWTGLSNGVAGIFCPALALLEFEDTTEPRLFGWSGSARMHGNQTVLHAADPHQLVCLDHLRAFVKLLPCGVNKGLAVPLGRELQLFNARFLSVRLHVTQHPVRVAAEEVHWSYRMRLEVSTVVNRAANHDLRPGSNLANLARFLSDFESTAAAVLPACCLCGHGGGAPAMASSRVVLEGAAGSGGSDTAVFNLSDSEQAQRCEEDQEPEQVQGQQTKGATCFRVRLREFWQRPAVSPPRDGSGGSDPAPKIQSYIAHGNTYRGSTLVYELTNTAEHSIVGLLWHTLPWAVELRFSTLRARLVDHGARLDFSHGGGGSSGSSSSSSSSNNNNSSISSSDDDDDAILLRILRRPLPRQHRHSPQAVEMLLQLPPKVVVEITVDFRRAFLYYSDYPSDAARGLDMSAPALSYWRTSSIGHSGVSGVSGGGGEGGENAHSTCLGALDTSIILEELFVCPPNGVVYAAAGLLVPFAWPDFSMPYNVICVSCTLPMLVFGTVLSGVTHRPKREPDPPRPLIAFILWWLRAFDSLFGD